MQGEGCSASEFLSKPHTKFHSSNSVTLGNFPGESHLRVPLPLGPQNLGETELGEFQTWRDGEDKRSRAWTNFQVVLSDSHRGPWANQEEEGAVLAGEDCGIQEDYHDFWLLPLTLGFLCLKRRNLRLYVTTLVWDSCLKRCFLNL